MEMLKALRHDSGPGTALRRRKCLSNGRQKNIKDAGGNMNTASVYHDLVYGSIPSEPDAFQWGQIYSHLLEHSVLRV